MTWARHLLVLAVSACLTCAALADDRPAGQPSAAEASKPADDDSQDGGGEPAGEDRHNESLRGRVVYLAEAMERLYGVKSVPEAAERTLALETPAGELVPLVENVRGRAFRVDKRLRALPDVELLVRRHRGSPAAQVIRVYSHERGQRLEIDYWCEICSIAMFELKACDCCQGDIELRRRPSNPPGPSR